jgi:putative phosphoribosyl transferase
MFFLDRAEAGRILASRLIPYKNKGDVVILALPRGGIPVAYEVGRELQLPIDVFVVRKLGVPGQEELAMGAIATGDIRIINGDVVEELGISQETIDAVTERERKELHRREQLYRGNRPSRDIRGRSVILVDDGIATGSTMRAAIAAIRQLSPVRIVVAVPVGAPETCKQLATEVDEIICVAMPKLLHSIGQFYGRFEQTSDEEVRDLLERAA